MAGSTSRVGVQDGASPSQLEFSFRSLALHLRQVRLSTEGFNTPATWTRITLPLKAGSSRPSVARPMSHLDSVFFVAAIGFAIAVHERTEVCPKELLADFRAKESPVLERVMVVETRVDASPKNLLEQVARIIEGVCVRRR